MHPKQLHDHARALLLALTLLIAPAGRALPQMAPGLTALISASLTTSVAPASTGFEGAGDDLAAVPPMGDAALAVEFPRASYAGRDETGVPHYLQRFFSEDERRLLREQFGIEEPQRLYLSDTLPSASLTYDSDWDRGERHLVNSYRVGAPSIRQAGETWEELERRLADTDPASFPPSVRRADPSLASLDPGARPQFERMLAAARRAGFRVKVTEARRSGERQAFLLTLDSRLTHTATSRHAEGFAVDVIVDDGNLADRVTRNHWVAFRRWVLAHEGRTFRLIGDADRSWDWPHIEYVEGPPAFRSIEGLLATARWCVRIGAGDCSAAWRSRPAGSPTVERNEHRK
ncbi:MAG TPA: hypothetical protein VMY76_11620 [Gemmatimonadales bacterium]|nr:hypothetical protein [Gemmatimonadales bacterium]